MKIPEVVSVEFVLKQESKESKESKKAVLSNENKKRMEKKVLKSIEKFNKEYKKTHNGN